MDTNSTFLTARGPYNDFETSGFLASLQGFVHGYSLFYSLVSLLLIYEVKRIVVIFRNQRPKNVKVIGIPSLLGNWITSIRYIYASQAVQNNAYAKENGRSYAIPTRNRYQVCVSSEKLIDELTNASIHQASLRHALWERAFPEQTIDGLSVDNIDKNGSLSQKVFRHHARLHLPSLRSLMQERLKEGLKTEIDNQKQEKGWTRVSAMWSLNRLVGKMNNVMFVGDSLASNSDFFESTMKYILVAGICEEVLQFTPATLVPFVGWVMMKASGVVGNVNKHLVPLVEERLNNKASQDSDRHKDTIQWVMNARPKASARDISQQVLSYIFGGAYQMPLLLNFALYNLCKHPEYQDILREEIALTGGVEFNHQNNELPLLDSFLKETARLNPITIFGMPRRIMHPFTFSDGTQVPAGNWIVVPQQAHMKDGTHYADPENFNGFRFVKDMQGASGSSESRLSHPSWLFPFWGSVKQACPARFYVTDMIKLILTELLMTYDIKLADENIPSSFAWGPLRVTHPRLAFLMKRRSGC